jgi:hypothetical protein
MANNDFRNPTNTNVVQIKTITITADSTSNTAVWTLTKTEDNGDTHTVAYTEDGSPTVAEIATGLYAAWSASVNPFIRQLNATNPSSGVLVLTAATAGVPFTVTLADSDDGTHTEVTTTACVGNSDYGTARNWKLGAVPTTGDDVIIDAAANGAASVDLLYSLNQSGVAIEDFRVLPGYTGKIGRFQEGLPFYLRIDPNLFRYEGAGQLGLFDIGSANIDVFVSSRGTPIFGRYAVNLKGSNIAVAYLQRGNIAIAPFDDDTATVATVNVGYVENQASDVKFLIGAGVTLTTLNQLGGVGELRCAATTVVNGPNSRLLTSGSGAITTYTGYGNSTLNSTGTITNLHVYGTVDLTASRAARTVTNCTVYPGGRLIRGPWVTFSNGIICPSTGAGQAIIEMRQ